MSGQKDKETKPAVQKSDLTYRSKMALETSIDGFCVVDFDGKLLEVNSSLCSITGYSRDELLRMKITDIEANETPEQTATHIDNIMKQGYDRFETKHRRKDGKIIDIEVSSQYCYSGEEKFFFSFFRDITEYKKAQNDLKASEARFRQLSDAAFEGIAIHENRRLFDVNQSFLDMFGYSLEELGNMDGLQLVAPDSRETVKGYIHAGLLGPYETIGITKNGSMFPIGVQARQMQFQGHTFRVVAVRDLTVQKKLEADTENYKENLLKAHRHAYIGSMGAIVAHQVNQPLTKINILLDRAIEQFENASCSPTALKDVKDGLEQAKKAASIIRSLRQYSKDFDLVGTGNVNVSAVTNRIVSVLSAKASRAKMNITIKGLADLPEVKTNETALEQMCLLIIQNAIEAADGKKQHKLDINGKFADGNIELQFADDCCGIAPEYLDKIFEPFFTTKSQDKSMGLGLNIVQQILIGCGGQIRVESRIANGTTFYVTLPTSNTLGAKIQ